jgi:hypothetical protein
MGVGVAKALVYTRHVLLMGSSVAAYNDYNSLREIAFLLYCTVK